MTTGFWKWAEAEPGRTALILPEGESMSYGALLEVSNRIAWGLRELGLRRGDSVSVLLPNCVEFVALACAALQAGLYLTPVNHHFTGDEISYVISDARTAVFFAHGRFAEAAQSASRAAKLDSQRCFSIRAIDGFRPFSEILSERSETVPDREAGMLSTYTSGTTGRPKGIRRGLTGADPDARAGAYNMLSMFGIEPGGEHVHLTGSPLYHSAPFGFLMFSLHFGHAVVLHDKWDPERVLADVERYRITHTQMVPTQFHRLLALPDDVKAQYDLSSLRVVAHAGAPCPVDVKANMIKWLGPIVYEYYGASEGVGGTFVSPKEALEHPGTVGRLLDPAAEIKILDDDGNEVAPGEVGTIYTTLVGGGGELEYFNDPAKSKEARRGNLFTVWDMGYLDSDGYLFLVSRRTDLILSGGVNIYPAEIEAVLTSHPDVADAAVFGIPNEEWGEEVKAVIQPVPGVAGDNSLTQRLRDFGASRLARLKIPRTFDYVEQLPRDPNGKLYKQRLRDPYWSNPDSNLNVSGAGSS